MDFDKCLTAAFEELYAEVLCEATIPDIEEIFIIEPSPESLISSMACLQPRNTESKFTLCTNFHVSISVDSISPPLPIPALFTKMFRDPASFLINSIADIQSSDLVTSKFMPWQDSSLHVF